MAMPSLPHEARIAVEVATQVSSEKLGLHMSDETQMRVFLQEGMAQLVALALLPGHEHPLSGLIGEANAAGLLDHEVSGRNLAAVDKAERQTVGKDRAQFLHEVKGKARATGPVCMQ